MSTDIYSSHYLDKWSKVIEESEQYYRKEIIKDTQLSTDSENVIKAFLYGLQGYAPSEKDLLQDKLAVLLNKLSTLQLELKRCNFSDAIQEDYLVNLILCKALTKALNGETLSYSAILDEAHCIGQGYVNNVILEVKNRIDFNLDIYE